jgi:hypothetical protein
LTKKFLYIKLISVLFLTLAQGVKATPTPPPAAPAPAAKASEPAKNHNTIYDDYINDDARIAAATLESLTHSPLLRACSRKALKNRHEPNLIMSHVNALKEIWRRDEPINEKEMDSILYESCHLIDRIKVMCFDAGFDIRHDVSGFLEGRFCYMYRHHPFVPAKEVHKIRKKHRKKKKAVAPLCPVCPAQTATPAQTAAPAPAAPTVHVTVVPQQAAPAAPAEAPANTAGAPTAPTNAAPQSTTPAPTNAAPQPTPPPGGTTTPPPAPGGQAPAK